MKRWAACPTDLALMGYFGFWAVIEIGLAAKKQDAQK
jgi:hypothetical protein